MTAQPAQPTKKQPMVRTKWQPLRNQFARSATISNQWCTKYNHCQSITTERSTINHTSCYIKEQLVRQSKRISERTEKCVLLFHANGSDVDRSGLQIKSVISGPEVCPEMAFDLLHWFNQKIIQPLRSYRLNGFCFVALAECLNALRLGVDKRKLFSE